MAGELSWLTDDDPVSGQESVRVFMEAMYAERQINIATPLEPGEHDDSDGRYKPSESWLKRKAADKEFCMVRATARGIINMKGFVAAAIKDAFNSGNLTITSYAGAATTAAGTLQVWFEGTKLEFALTVWQRKQMTNMVKYVLPAMKEYNLPITDEIMSQVVAEDASINIPHKLRHAMRLINDDQDRKGMVTKDTAEYIHKALSGNSITLASMEQEVNTRTGTKDLVLLPGVCEIIYDGKRQYTLILDDDMGEIFERRTPFVDWRSAAA